MPRLSICIPTYNQLESLKRLIYSIEIQTYSDFEIIISDDSSNNEIENYIALLSNNKIVYSRNQIPLGPPANWNRAIALSTGDYIKIMHHDDWLAEENSLALFVDTLDKDIKLSFCYSNIKNVRKDGSFYISAPRKNQTKILNDRPWELYCGNFVGPPSSVMYRRNSIVFDINLKWLVDVDFYLRLIQLGPSVHIDEVLVLGTVDGLHQVTRICENDKNIQLYEFFYVYNKFYKFMDDISNKRSINILRKIVSRFNVINENAILSTGYSGYIPLEILSFIKVVRFSYIIGRIKTYL
jgi:glycosyltransferase involved in cell wall biosynthesis